MLLGSAIRFVAVKRVPFRRLVFGPAPGADRILFYSLWFRGHNNPRYAELLPRLDRLDAHLLTLPDLRLLRGAAYRSLNATKRARDRLALRVGARRYRALFTVDNEQIELFPGPVVADVDDPTFSEREVELLSLPNLVAYVVTAERAARRFEQLGLDKPSFVIPQGVAHAALSDREKAEVATRHRADGEFVVGYMAAWLLSHDDRGGENPLYNVDHLLDLWDEIHGRLPPARLWLL